MSKDKELSLIEAFERIEAELLEASGYPNRTVKSDSLAFAYGLVLGTVSKLKWEWKERLK